jgi:hypothetical protein
VRGSMTRQWSGYTGEWRRSVEQMYERGGVGIAGCRGGYGVCGVLARRAGATAAALPRTGYLS